MFKFKNASWRHLKRWSLIHVSLLLILISFNNCGPVFTNSTSETIGGWDSASRTPNNSDGTSDQPTNPIPTPNNPNTPAQPQPAPIVPIVMTNQPAWMNGKNLNEWIEIPDTAGAGGTAIHAFCGLALREATSEIIIGAAGGHGDSSDNRVVSLVLATDQPKWVTRIGPSPYPEVNVSHYKDGTPSARHTYQSTYYIEALDRFFLIGARYVFGTPPSFRTVDAFSFKTNQWDPPNTWAPVPADGEYGIVKVPGTDDIYTNGLAKFSASQALAMLKQGTPSSSTIWSRPITTRTDTSIRFPIAYDKKRNQLFTLQYGDGQGYNAPHVYSSRIDLASGVQTKVTIKPGPVYDLFIKEAPVYAAMDYDVVNDLFLFYSGQGEARGRIYVIKPTANNNEYEMSLMQTIAGSKQVPATMTAGLNSNFKYVPALKGFLLLANRGANLHFIKTAQ